MAISGQSPDDKLLPTPQTMDAIGMTRPVEWKGKSPRIKSNQGVDGQAGLRDVIASLPKEVIAESVETAISESQRMEALTFLRADSHNHVNLFPMPDSDVARKMTVISGTKCLGLLKSSNRIGLLAKMLLVSSQWHSNKVSLTWKVKPILKKVITETVMQGEFFAKSSIVSKVSVIPSKHLLFQLAPSTHHIEEIEYGLLPTENRLLKTPSASEADGGAKTDDKYWNAKAPKLKLRDQIAKVGMLPTPRTGNPGSRPNQKGGKILAEEVGKKVGLRLQPNFVEWMQGLPQGWTDLNLPVQGIEQKD